MTTTASNFQSIDAFIAALNDYDGDNIWYQLIYAARIKGDKINFDKTSEVDGEICFQSGQVVLYHELAEVWS